MRAADGDERHGPFLPKRGYEDEAQCDINPSLSPLLKHYRAADPRECETPSAHSRLSGGAVALDRRAYICWLNRSRRLSKDFEAFPAMTETWGRVAMIHLMVRRLAAGA